MDNKTLIWLAIGAAVFYFFVLKPRAAVPAHPVGGVGTGTVPPLGAGPSGGVAQGIAQTLGGQAAQNPLFSNPGGGPTSGAQDAGAVLAGIGGLTQGILGGLSSTGIFANQTSTGSPPITGYAPDGGGAVYDASSGDGEGTYQDTSFGSSGDPLIDGGGDAYV